MLRAVAYNGASIGGVVFSPLWVLLIAHRFSLLVPALGAQAARLAMGFATACAIGGRLLVASVLPPGANRRTVAALVCGVQLVGSVTLLLVNDLPRKTCRVWWR